MTVPVTHAGLFKYDSPVSTIIISLTFTPSYPAACKLTHNYTLTDSIAVPIIKTATGGLLLLVYSCDAVMEVGPPAALTLL